MPFGPIWENSDGQVLEEVKKGMGQEKKAFVFYLINEWLLAENILSQHPFLSPFREKSTGSFACRASNHHLMIVRWKTFCRNIFRCWRELVASDQSLNG
jgi:hypothetical protein